MLLVSKRTIVNKKTIVGSTTSAVTYYNVLLSYSSIEGFDACVNWSGSTNLNTYLSECVNFTDNCNLLNLNKTLVSNGYYSNGINSWLLTSGYASSQTNCPIYYDVVLSYSNTNDDNACLNWQSNTNKTTYKSNCLTLSAGCKVITTAYTSVSDGYYTNGTISWDVVSGILLTSAACSTYYTIVLTTSNIDGSDACLNWLQDENKNTYKTTCQTLTNGCNVYTTGYTSVPNNYYSDGNKSWYVLSNVTQSEATCPTYYDITLTYSNINGGEACLNWLQDENKTVYKTSCLVFGNGCILYTTGYTSVNNGFYSDGSKSWNVNSNLSSSELSCPTYYDFNLAYSNTDFNNSCINWSSTTNVSTYKSTCSVLSVECTLYTTGYTNVSNGYYSDGVNSWYVNSNNLETETNCPIYYDYSLAYSSVDTASACVNWSANTNILTYKSTCTTLTDNCILVTTGYTDVTNGYYSNGLNSWSVTSNLMTGQVTCPQYYDVILSYSPNSGGTACDMSTTGNTSSYKTSCSSLSNSCVILSSGFLSVSDGFYSNGTDYWNVTSNITSNQTRCPVLTGFTYIASAGTSTQTIVIPASSEPGDFAILFDYAQNSTSAIPTSVTPSGWSSITTNTLVASSIGYRSNISIETIITGDAGKTITGMTGTAAIRKILLVFRPNKNIISIANPARNGIISAANPTAQGLTLTNETYPHLVFGHYVSTGSITLRTATGPTFVEVRNVATHYVKYAIVNSGTTRNNASIDMDDNGVNTLQSTYFTFT